MFLVLLKPFSPAHKHCKLLTELNGTADECPENSRSLSGDVPGMDK
jgi:hypothetical protein